MPLALSGPIHRALPHCPVCQVNILHRRLENKIYVFNNFLLSTFLIVFSCFSLSVYHLSTGSYLFPSWWYKINLVGFSDFQFIIQIIKMCKGSLRIISIEQYGATWWDRMFIWFCQCTSNKKWASNLNETKYPKYLFG